MVLTNPLCPLLPYIVSQVEKRIRSIQGVEFVEVHIDRETLWNAELMTDEGRRRLSEILW